ncbi:MAG: hypothetical protein ACRD0S_12180 [Acidimicrobiales bacterium]
MADRPVLLGVRWLASALFPPAPAAVETPIAWLQADPVFAPKPVRPSPVLVECGSLGS